MSQDNICSELPIDRTVPEGAWHVPGELISHSDLLVLVSEGKLDSRRIEKHDNCTLVYTEADLRHRTAVADQLLSVLRGSTAKLLYWSKANSLPRGDLCYRRVIPGSKAPRKRHVVCSQCDAPTVRRDYMFGRCIECVTNYPIISWGTYGGMPAKQVSRIPQEERDYTGMEERDKKLLEALDRDMCRRCGDSSRCQPLFAGMCCRCLETGHVKLSSGKYSGEPVMLVASNHEAYDGSDLTREDLRLLTVAREQLDFHHESSEQLCEIGPYMDMTFKEVAREDLSWYKTRPQRNHSLLCYCATEQLIRTGVPR